jgi:hypothetical protein
MYIAIAVVLVILLLMWSNSGNPSLVEGFGEKIKVIRSIPMNNCLKICDQYFNHCMHAARYSSGAAHACGRIKDSCNSECYYSYYQRL